MNIGQYIKKLRLDHNMTQEEVGAFVGVQRAAVQKWECGKTQNIKRPTLQKLAELFRVPASSFIAEIVVDQDLHLLPEDAELLAALRARPLLRELLQVLMQLDQDHLAAFMALARFSDSAPRKGAL